MSFQFRLIHKDKHCSARAGEMVIDGRGTIPTPVFMPVGTHGAMKAISTEDVADIGSRMILANTYHLHLSPGEDLIAKGEGLHKFMNWPHGLLTDSGGFQVFSLPGKSIYEEGVKFTHGGKEVFLSPESSISIQKQIGADIIMAFDECIPWPSTYSYTEKSIARTHRWLDRCIKAWEDKSQALFGIVQGSTYKELRQRCVEEVCSQDLKGHAIGGVSVGEGSGIMEEIVGYTAPLLPPSKPRYVMGVGTPEDLLTIWQEGIDMSDCVIPTRLARGGSLFTSRGKIRITHRRYRRDFYPIDKSCPCRVCHKYTRAYIRHLFSANEILGTMLATFHNIAFYTKLATDAREAILKDNFLSFKKKFLASYQSGD